MDIRSKFEKYKSVILKFLEAKDFRKVINLLHRIQRPFMLKRSKQDIYECTPYNRSVSEKFGLGYVNASFVSTKDGELIAAQEPKNMFLEDFFSLVVKSNTTLIVSLIPSPVYLEGNTPISSILVTFEDKPFLFDEVYIISDRKVRVLRCLSWLDHGVLTLEEMEFLYNYYSSIPKQMQIIHCKAGVGRTGTFIMYSILKKLESVTINQFIDVLIDLRCFRAHLVQNEKQLKFLADIFLEGKNKN